MFIATDAKQQRWNCLEKIPMKKEGPFFCLLCGKEVRLKKGPVMRPHFAHISLEDCPFHHETESPEHLELKLGIYQWAKQNSNAEVESPLQAFQQIADVLKQRGTERKS